MQINLVNALAQYLHIERERHTNPYTESNTNAVQRATPLLGDTVIQQTLEALTNRFEALANNGRQIPPLNNNDDSLPTINPRTV